MKEFFENNYISIFGFNLPFAYILILFAVLLLLSLLIYVLSFILKKRKGQEERDKKEIEISKIDEEINSIVKKYKITQNDTVENKEAI